MKDKNCSSFFVYKVEFHPATILMRLFLIFLSLMPQLSYSQVNIIHKNDKKYAYYTIVSKTEMSTIVYDTTENILVKKSAEFLADDIEKVTGKRPVVASSEKKHINNIIIIATIGKNKLIDRLVAEKKIKIESLVGQWEKFMIQTIDKPFPGVKRALIILGSDRRGAAYGVFTLSEKMGVSPWYWWADVPVEKHEEIFIENCSYISKAPAVKYRGVFINDESPAFRNWAKENFGGINHKCYEKIFELLLRNKANFMWPSMWLPTMFYVDDPLNPKTADDYGIVMSTSHHEPMTRAHNEWSLNNGGEWNYKTNKEKLKEFWRTGFERVGNYETVVTVGMRGDGDDRMSQETAVDLLKTIIKDQRVIIADVTDKPAEETPQLWAIYKEVQDYYDKGMRVDKDITVLFSDDNWGNIRYLPQKNDTTHSKYGMYYHFDYVGAPISYRWLNVTQIERVWEQMKLTYEYGVNEIWIANVGDIKPMELPISFFLDYAWDPSAIEANDLPGYYIRWAKQQFGNEHADEIGEILSLYTKYNARRTPEMLAGDTYSIENYREADKIVEEYKKLLEKSTSIFNSLPSESKSAYYQLVQSPVEMCSNLNEMFVAAGKNKYYAARGATSANFYADKVKELFEKDAELTKKYHDLVGGKWNYMMSQTHIGYTAWNHPPVDIMPAVSYVKAQKLAKLGYLIEYGTLPSWEVEAYWNFNKEMPAFDPVNDQNYFIDVINQGQDELSFTVKPKEAWIKLSSESGKTRFNEKIYVSIDWTKAPEKDTLGELYISGAGEEYTVKVPIRYTKPDIIGFVENQGVVAFEADHFARKTDSKDVHWTIIPNLGRTGSSLIIEPVTAVKQFSPEESPLVEYDFTTFKSGAINVRTYLSPTQDFKKQGGLRYAISIDNEEPQVININDGETRPDYEYANWWMKSVGDHIKIKSSKHTIDKPGKHTLRFWVIDTGIVLQRLVIDFGVVRPSYLGPVESKYVAVE
ncbi:MAG TPA: glycosyl hydrolase 115 family protein [Bacteroidales bacterium]|nr:glycosyl hydrolase 115 family protein [Bacteroidales bacterium]